MLGDFGDYVSLVYANEVIKKQGSHILPIRGQNAENAKADLKEKRVYQTETNHVIAHKSQRN